MILFDLCSDLHDVDLTILKNKNLNLKDESHSNLELIARIANDESIQSYEWTIFAGRIELFMLRSKVGKTFSNAMLKLKDCLDAKYLQFVIDNADVLNEMIDNSRDERLDYFAIFTLKNSYCKHDFQGNIQETPSYMYLRIASFLHYPHLNMIKSVYDNLSQGNYTQATPTIVNSGTKRPGLSSCVTMSVYDNMENISASWTKMAILSKNCAGIGADFTNLRHSKIHDGSISQGIVPWLRIVNEIIKGVPQRERKGSAAIYLEVWHTDVFEFIEAKDPSGNPELKARYLFYGLMICDLFMKRVENDEMWSLFCPNIAKRLDKTYGKEFEDLYISYERKELATKHIPARKLWDAILRVQTIVGSPYILFKDAINRKCNQTHDGDIVRLSNLCTEITGVTNEQEIFSCNLASISVNNCIEILQNKPTYNFNKLANLTREVVRNLDNAVNRTHYPEEIPELRRANFKRRPLGIGIQGLADAAALMDISWVNYIYDNEGNKILRPHEKNTQLVNGSKVQQMVPQLTHNPEFRQFHFNIFETMYFAGIKESIELAKEEGPYPTFDGSPTSKGLFQIDLWILEHFNINTDEFLADTKMWYERYLDFIGLTLRTPYSEIEKIRKDMILFKLRNSLIFAEMPTATSAHILGNNECFEPFNNLIGKRRVLTGEYKLVNKYFIKEARELGIWNTELYQHVSDNQDISYYEKPKHVSQELWDKLVLKYTTIFNIPQKLLLELSRDRGLFVCQSQSMNCHMNYVTSTRLHHYLMYAWKLKLKTGLYYLRQLEKVKAINYTISSIKINETPASNEAVCTSCSV